jgi:exonuclease III
MHQKRQSKPGRTAILVGDMNVAPTRIDYYNPEDPWMKRQAGTTADEQNSFQQNYIANGFVDTFRAVFPSERMYSYFNPRKGALAYKRKEGLRIDFVLVGRVEAESQALTQESYVDMISTASLPVPYIMDEVWSPYSDHSPVGASIPLVH